MPNCNPKGPFYETGDSFSRKLLENRLVTDGTYYVTEEDGNVYEYYATSNEAAQIINSGDFVSKSEVTAGGVMVPGETVAANTTLRALDNYWYNIAEATVPDPIVDEAGLIGAGWLKIDARALVSASGRDLSSISFLHNGHLYASASGKAPLSVTDWSVGVDMHTGSLRVLPKQFSDGVVWLGKVSTDASGITAFSLEETPWSRPCAIPAFQSKIRRGEGVSVFIMGDSLSSQLSNADGNLWPDMVFGNLVAQGVRATDDGGNNTDNTDVKVLAVPGSTAELGVAQVATLIAAPTNITISGQAISLGANQTVTGDYQTGTSDALNADLIMIAYGMNGGKQDLIQLEKTVRMIKANSSAEIMLITSNFSAADFTRLEDECELIREMADIYGCAVADSWSYVYEAHKNVLDGDEVNLIYPTDDNIHPTFRGQREWGRAIRSCFPNFDLVARAAVNVLPNEYIAESLDSDFDKTTNKRFDGAEFQYIPSNTTGARSTDTAGLSVIDGSVATSSVYYNRRYRESYPQWRLTAESLYEPLILLPGEYAEFSHEATFGHRFVLERSSNATYDVSINGAAAYSEEGDDGSDYPRVANKNGESIDLSDTASQQLIRIENTGSGSDFIRVMGCLFHTRGGRDIPFAEMDFVGTWTNSSYDYSADSNVFDLSTLYSSDTVGDYVVIPFKGRGIELVYSRSKMSGFHQVFIDGLEVQTPVDEFRNNNTLAMRARINFFAGGEGNHICVLKLSGDSASTTTAGTNRSKISLIKATEW